MHNATPSPDAVATNSWSIIPGRKGSVVDTKLLEAQASRINYPQVRERRHLFNRLYHEAKLSEEPGRGMSFTSMLMMLAHSKLIDDEKALL